MVYPIVYRKPGGCLVLMWLPIVLSNVRTAKHRNVEDFLNSASMLRIQAGRLAEATSVRSSGLPLPRGIGLEKE